METFGIVLIVGLMALPYVLMISKLSSSST